MQVKFEYKYNCAANEYVTCRLSQNTHYYIHNNICQNYLIFWCFRISKYFVMHRIQDTNIFDITLIIPNFFLFSAQFSDDTRFIHAIIWFSLSNTRFSSFLTYYKIKDYVMKSCKWFFTVRCKAYSKMCFLRWSLILISFSFHINQL